MAKKKRPHAKRQRTQRTTPQRKPPRRAGPKRQKPQPGEWTTLKMIGIATVPPVAVKLVELAAKAVEVDLHFFHLGRLPLLPGSLPLALLLILLFILLERYNRSIDSFASLSTLRLQGGHISHGNGQVDSGNWNL